MVGHVPRISRDRKETCRFEARSVEIPTALHAPSVGLTSGTMMKRFVQAVGVVAVLSIAATWAGCLCVGSGGHDDEKKQTPLQRCITDCTLNQASCNYTCNHDPQCARTCAESNQLCIRACEKHDGYR